MNSMELKLHMDIKWHKYERFIQQIDVKPHRNKMELKMNKDKIKP